MTLKADTKIVKNAGSLRSTVPKKIAEMLNLDEGDCIHWVLHVNEKGPTLTLSPLKKSS